MPLPVENLTQQSTDKDATDAIGQSIAQCIREGKSQKECAGMAYGIAEEKLQRKLRTKEIR